jgi:hypothetical protein
MPITLMHLGPGVLQKAVAPKMTDLRLYAVASLAIDAEPIFKGVTELLGWAQWTALHTWTHEMGSMVLICLLCGLAWNRMGLCSRWTAFWTAMGAASTHWLLDSLMHGGGDMPALLPPSLQGYGSDLAHGLAFWSFVIGGAVLLSQHWRTVVAWLRRELGT